jgi:hypothetical protein
MVFVRLGRDHRTGPPPKVQRTCTSLPPAESGAQSTVVSFIRLVLARTEHFFSSAKNSTDL